MLCKMATGVWDLRHGGMYELTHAPMQAYAYINDTESSNTGPQLGELDSRRKGLGCPTFVRLNKELAVTR